MKSLSRLLPVLGVTLGLACLAGTLKACKSESGAATDKSECDTSAVSTYDAAADVHDRTGAIVRHDTTQQVIYLIFSADSMFEGAPVALEAMAERGIKGNFFFTGNFLERPCNGDIVRRIVGEGHYVGGHSNRHMLLADWGRERTELVTVDSMLSDVRANLAKLDSMGVATADARWFMPPFEWIAPSQVPVLTDSLGLHVINPTPGIEIYRDYTTPDMAEYHSSRQLIDQLFEYESERGMNGVFLIFHLGTQDVRTDKLYHHLPMLLDSLTTLGYTFDRLH